MAITIKCTISTLIGLEDASELSSYYLRNEKQLRPFEPVKSNDYNTLTAWKTRVKIFAYASRPICHTIKKNNSLIVVVSFTNVVYGVFQACHLGFSLDEKQQGKGLMFEILSVLIPLYF